MHSVLLALVACGPRERVKWDSVEEGDTLDDVVVSVLLFGTVEQDRGEIEGPHVAGGSLRMRAARFGADAAGWEVFTLEPEIARVVTALPEGDALYVELAFLRQGTTDLYVVDRDGAVLDVQALAVRDPAAAELVPWEWLSTGEATGVRDGILRTVQGGRLDLAVTWLDAVGERLMGGEVLRVETEPTAGVTVGASFTGEIDILELSVDDDAPLATFPVDLYAGTRHGLTASVVVHGPDEVADLELVTWTRGDEGSLGARLATSSGEELLGVPVTFRWADDEATGTVLLWGEGEPTEVEACYEGAEVPRCEAITLRGTPTGVAEREAPVAGGDCGGCSTSAAALGGSAWLAAGLLRRRRQRRPNTPAR